MKFSPKIFLYCRGELYLWFIILGQFIRGVTFTQLIQDKICKFHKMKNDTFCLKLSDIGDNDHEYNIKSDVLVDSSQFTMYYTALTFLPSVIACLFLGSWCDNYKPGRKILLCLSAFGLLLETGIQSYMAYNFKLDYWYALLASVPGALGGGLATALIAVYSYIPATSPPDLSTIRFMFAEVVISLGGPLATLLGGFLLNYNTDHPIGGNGQLLNYQVVFITSAILFIIAFFWAIFLVNEKQDKLNLEKFSNDPAFIYKQIQKSQQRRTPNIRPLESIIEEKSSKNPFKLLFNWGNIKDIIKTGTKSRPNRARLQLWLLILSFVFVLLAYMAPMFVMFPFAQKVYLWDSKVFSTYNSTANFINSVGILFGTLILTKVYNMDDLPLAICGISACMICNIVRASFPNLWGFWISTIIGCLSGMASIGIRSYISKIIAEDEVTKIFSLIASIDGSIPLVGNFFFTMIFTQTLDNFPGAVFDVNAGLLLIPMLSVMFIDNFCRKKVHQNINNNNNLNINTNIRNKRKDKEYNKNEEQLTYRTRGIRTLRQISTEI